MIHRPKIGLILLALAALCPTAGSTQGVTPESQLEAPMVIVFSTGRWHHATTLEERGGSLIYSKPGAGPVAVSEYDVSRKWTLEVNEALAGLVAACNGDIGDFSRSLGLKGKARQIFSAVVREKLPDCYRRGRDAYALARSQANQAGQKKTLSEYANNNSIEKDEDSTTTVISNANVGDGDSAVSQGGRLQSDRYDHFGEYIVRSKGVIKDECSDEWAGNYKMYRHCVKDETNAVNQLKARGLRMTLDEFGGIRDRCRDSWPRDYSMRDNCEVEQVLSYRSIERKMEDPDFSKQNLQAIKAACAGEWPDNFRMQETCVEKTMEKQRPSF